MQLNGSLVLAKARPGKQGEAEVNGGRVQCIDVALNVKIEIIPLVQVLCLQDEHLGEVGVYSPGSALIRLGKGASGDAAPEAHVIQPALHRIQGEYDIPETEAVGQLGECQAKELVPAGKRLDPMVAAVPGDTLAELIPRRHIHDLGENRHFGTHKTPLGMVMG